MSPPSPLKWKKHRHLRNIDCLTVRTASLVMNVSFVSCRSRKKKKRRLFCAALVAGTVNKLEQSILHLRYLWEEDTYYSNTSLCQMHSIKSCRVYLSRKVNSLNSLFAQSFWLALLSSGLYYKNILMIVSDNCKCASPYP
jgi:hypothetical protein